MYTKAQIRKAIERWVLDQRIAPRNYSNEQATDRSQTVEEIAAKQTETLIAFIEHTNKKEDEHA